jgi:hypothetical protein
MLDEVVPELVAAFERILEPWFSGQQKLDYERLKGMTDGVPESDWIAVLLPQETPKGTNASARLFKRDLFPPLRLF